MSKQLSLFDESVVEPSNKRTSANSRKGKGKNTRSSQKRSPVVSIEESPQQSLELKVLMNNSVDPSYANYLERIHSQLTKKEDDEWLKKITALSDAEYSYYRYLLVVYGLNSARQYVLVVTNPKYLARKPIIKDSLDNYILAHGSSSGFIEKDDKEIDNRDYSTELVYEDYEEEDEEDEDYLEDEQIYEEDDFC